MAGSSSLSSQAADKLRAAIAGDVFLPGQRGYDEARRAWNLAADQRPAVVVHVRSAADVVEAVRLARSAGMRIAPQGTGHGSVTLESLAGAMLIRTLSLRQVEVDPATRTARAEAGAQWRDVAVPAAEHGLAALAGTSATVGVAGYTLGGGLGWLARRFGLAANSVTAAEVVTADGRLVRTDKDHEPGLLWAIRGGGGSVGVVTALEMTLYPARELYAGALFFPIQRSAEVLHAWRQWTGTLPDEVTSIGRILRVPAIPTAPERLRGRAFAMVEAACLAGAAAGTELIQPLRRLGPELDTFAPTPVPALGRVHMDPGEPIPFRGDGALLADLPPAAIDTLVSLTGPDSATPLASTEIRHLGGALARAVPGAAAQPAISAGYLVYANALTPTSELADTVRAHARALRDALAPWHASYDNFNLRESPADASSVLSPASYRRLREIKAACDPGQAIISVHPAWPAARP
jgi:FAD/FMN-containing dehydrogenase